ncbi:hypothetical protein BDN71DRAFT_1507499 [Pleurotus eryngii]|uniref:Uncharacterized protein n=1 Tax=Pleurotus eryngii TaxID=5323 RepID=A0A9P6DFJ8_PLEER|nr:hypothetical protein BDN71DRAFT_1507499 [Pleurotus eryngii]
MSDFLRRGASGPFHSHSREHHWNPVSTTSWALPTPRPEVTGVRQETLSHFPTSPNDPFQASGHDMHLNLQMKDLESHSHYFECAYNKEHEKNIELRTEVKVLRSNFEQLLEVVRNPGTEDAQSMTKLGSTAPVFADPVLRNCLAATLPMSDRNEYPNVKFWTRSQWTEANIKFKSETKISTNPTSSDAKPRKRRTSSRQQTEGLCEKRGTGRLKTPITKAVQLTVCHHCFLEEGTDQDQLNNDTDDADNEDIYYEPGFEGALVESRKAVIIDDPLSTLFAEQQAPVVAVSAALNHTASEPATGASVDQFLQLSTESNTQKSTTALPAPSSIPIAPAFPAASPIGSIDTDKPLEDTRLVEPSDSPRNQPAPPETSEQVPLATTRSQKPRRATVGKVNNPKNRCKSAWLAQHPNGDEEEFKVYWNGVKESYKG